MNEVERVIKSLEDAHLNKGLAVHRYQTNARRGYGVHITYAAHPSYLARPARSADCQKILCTLRQREGRTSRCESFRELFAALRRLHEQR